MRVAIIGAGAGGLFVGANLSGKAIVVIFDGNEKAGKKIYITGKGRCNLTNNCDKEKYLDNVVNGKKFMMSAISQFEPKDTINFFEEHGLKLKTERGGRVFPLSDKASDVTKTLLSCCRQCDFHFNEKVKKITFSGDMFEVETDKGKYVFDKVVVATGGKSYPLTGSTGDGYHFAEDFSHNIIKPKGALVPIKLGDKFVKGVMGLSLKNVTLKGEVDGKTFSFFGEALFTDKGISGPIALSLSSMINTAKNVALSLDFKPALTEEEVEKRLLRDFEGNLNRNLSFVIKGLLPKNLVEPFLEKAGISPEKKVNSVSVKERKSIAHLLKNFGLDYQGLYPIESGIITSGGVDLKQISPKTMESKLQKGLYFVGEVLDVDCLTGGFNLQTAFSTAYACAKAIEKDLQGGKNA